LVRDFLRAVGDNPYRDGLRDTPKRVIRSWEELYSGYNSDAETVLATSFEASDEGTGDYDQIILLKDIELFSTCEHHMLPFFGRASVAYVPAAGGKVVGISKLARLVECFSRRLQIQERIGQQVVSAIDQYLGARGAACIIEAQHLCMMSRGVSKQHSVMVTSFVSGVFRDDPDIKNELFMLLGK
jgi:GTP cyclohydrolase I